MISICIATYNGDNFIKEQIQSILYQISGEDEIIISDDSSKDRTIEIINSFNDPRIKIYINQGKKGVIPNFENALKKAKGEYIFLSDQDDIWLPDKIDKSIKYLQEYDAVMIDCKIVDNNIQVIYESLFEQYNSKTGLIRNIFKNSYSGACMAFRREILKIALPFPKSIPMHDIWLGFVIELFFKVYFIQEKLLLHRVHECNVTATGEKSPFAIHRRIVFRINILKHIPLLLYRRYLGN